MNQGEITRIIPHRATGRADYFGPPVNRAARFLAASAPGQVLAERTLVEECVEEWSAEGVVSCCGDCHETPLWLVQAWRRMADSCYIMGALCTCRHALGPLEHTLLFGTGTLPAACGAVRHQETLDLSYCVSEQQHPACLLFHFPCV